LTDLEELSANTGVGLRVVFIRPAGVAEGWERGELWDRAVAIPGTNVECDPKGAEARRRGATTSGHVVLQSSDGTSSFSGGITSGRGRSGESAGRCAIQAILRGEASSIRVAPVFGCPLLSPVDRCREDGAECQRKW
jgi:hypothetical protein